MVYSPWRTQRFACGCEARILADGVAFTEEGKLVRTPVAFPRYRADAFCPNWRAKAPIPLPLPGR